MDPILETDQYKFAMAEAGWPLREETFYYSHRKGGPHLLPVDVKEYIKGIFHIWQNGGLIKISDDIKYNLAEVSGLHVGAWFEHFYNLKNPFDKLTIKTIPKGSWFYDRDPVFTVTGPSFLLSWLEPQILQLHYRIQVATLAAKGLLDEKVNRINMLTCNGQKTIVEEALETVRSLGYEVPEMEMHVQSDTYMINVESRVRQLIDAVGGGAHRLFEVGLRAATCGEQHDLTLMACKKAGLTSTSDTFGAIAYNMRAVGTMGHEHVQRFGSDEVAYNAMADRLPGSIFCLLDTYDTYESGFPAARDLMARQPERKHVIRFDSGNIVKQFQDAVHYFDFGSLKESGYNARYCLEDGWNLTKTVEIEKIINRRRHTRDYKNPWFRFDPNNVLYGYGGFITNCGWTSMTRDRVAAVWKLTQTGDTPTMKFGSADGKGKESIPGKPILWVMLNRCMASKMPKSIVAQKGEDLTKRYGDLYQKAYESEPLAIPYESPYIVPVGIDNEQPNAYSDATKILRHSLYEKKLKTIRRSKEKWQ
ncbi:hypothetical protein LCGC14_0469550 [marine sediment metagenome]|uniref:nicotinate phosphoribosyltransferase n=1 Tax=marine sediment metagenome TaxID=412755 RepID=A0A0F9SCL9_9ZZZZ